MEPEVEPEPDLRSPANGLKTAFEKPVVPILSTRGQHPPPFLLTRNSQFRRRTLDQVFATALKDSFKDFLPQKTLKVRFHIQKVKKKRPALLSLSLEPESFTHSGYCHMCR